MNYLDYKNAFITKHSAADWQVDTTPMRSDGGYVKTYIFSDGAVLTEINRPVTELAKAEAIVKGVKVQIAKRVTLMETEAWNTDDARSVKFYEEW